MLKALSEAKNIDIFRSRVNLFVEYKWQMDQGYVLGYGFFLIFYSLALFIDCILHESFISKIIVLGYSIIILGTEFY